MIHICIQGDPKGSRRLEKREKEVLEAAKQQHLHNGKFNVKQLYDQTVIFVHASQQEFC